MVLCVSGFSRSGFAQDVPQAPAAPRTQTTQQPAQAQPEAAPHEPDDMDKIPDEYIEEAFEFQKQCSTDYSFNQYYNCECLSLAYLDERVKVGPTIPGSEIQLNIRDQCRDALNSAGQIYNGCIKKANRFAAGTDPETYCKCVTNTYIKNMNDFAPQINSNSIVQYQTQAYVYCRNKMKQDGLNPSR